MKNNYLVFNTRIMFAFLISSFLFFSCRQDQFVQEFSKQQEPTSTTLASAKAASVTYNIFPSTSSGISQSAPSREVGVKFRVTQAGYITGIRFYKGTANTGTHIGHLWSSTGTKLAEANFTNETASGWQQVLFTTPVAVITGTTYVASYFSSRGYHAITYPYFASAVVNGPLRALASTEDGGNGVYKNSTVPAFPNTPSSLLSNFWVDVVFSTDVTQVTETTTTSPVTGIKYLLLPRGTSQTYSNRSNLVIENLSFSNKNSSFQNGHNLVFNGCSNITIRNCYFGSSAGVGIYTNGSTNVRIENCLFAYNSTGIVGVRSSGIYAKNCQYINMWGKGTFGAGGGEFYKLIECSGAGNGVENCRGENFPGESNPEDIVSLFKSSGTTASPILITGNIFRGGGPSTSGGGIVAGDGDNSVTGSNVLITNNTLVDPGQYGIAAAGGTNITITGNKIYAKQQPWSNNPLFVWNQYSPACGNITVKSNRVNWTDKNGNINNGWNAGNCSNTIFEKPTSITLAEMNVPAQLVSFITAAELLTVRQSK